MYRPAVISSLAFLLYSFTSDAAAIGPLLNNNSSLTLPSSPRECNGDYNTFCFGGYQNPTFSFGDAVQFTRNELEPAARKARHRGPWVFDGSKMRFSISDFGYLADAVACARFTIENDYAESERVSSTSFTIYRLADVEHGEEICKKTGVPILGTGYFGAPLSSEPEGVS